MALAEAKVISVEPEIAFAKAKERSVWQMWWKQYWNKTKGEPIRLDQSYRETRLRNVKFVHPSVSYNEFMASPATAKRIEGNGGEYFLEYFKLSPSFYTDQTVEGKKKKNFQLSEVFKEKKDLTYLGKPGRQGTTIKINIKGIDYAIKFVKEPLCNGINEYTYLDDINGSYFQSDDQGETKDGQKVWEKSCTFLMQARFQQLAADWGCTCPVYGVGTKDGVSFLAMPVMKARLIDVYKKNSSLSYTHQRQLWNIYIKLDVFVGITHSDNNCLNVMLDENDRVILIDFDRAMFKTEDSVKKKGPYENLYLLGLVNCFGGVFASYRIHAPELYIKYHKMFAQQSKTPTPWLTLGKKPKVNKRQKFWQTRYFANGNFIGNSNYRQLPLPIDCSNEELQFLLDPPREDPSREGVSGEKKANQDKATLKIMLRF